MKTKISHAQGVSASELCEAMRASFSDYAVPLNLTQPRFDLMMLQRGLNLEASRVATVNGKIAAIWLVSVRGTAAYLISSGTLPEFRSMGLAKALATDCISGLKRAGIATFQTEVLTENTVAASLYHKIGMQPLRQLSCYKLSDGDIPEGPSHIQVEERDWQDVAGFAPLLRDWDPSWQNNDFSLNEVAEDVHCYCLTQDQAIAGYAAVIAETGTVAQIGVDPDTRRKGIATTILKTAAGAAPSGSLNIVNAQESDVGFSLFMEHLKAEQTMGQIELFMQLSAS